MFESRTDCRNQTSISLGDIPCIKRDCVDILLRFLPQQRTALAIKSNEGFVPGVFLMAGYLPSYSIQINRACKNSFVVTSQVSNIVPNS